LIICFVQGQTGVHALRAAVNRNYKVTVLVRNKDKLPADLRDKAHVVVGDVLKSEDVATAMKGQHVVVSALGPESKQMETFMTDSTKNIVTAMKDCKVRRLIMIGGVTTPDPNDKESFSGKMVAGMLKLFIKKLMIDTNNASAYIDMNAKELDWTIVRAPRLTLEPAKGAYKHAKTMVPGASDKLSREDLGNFLVFQITDKNYIRLRPIIRN